MSQNNKKMKKSEPVHQASTAAPVCTRGHITIGEREVLSTFATLWTTRSASPSEPSDLQGFHTADQAMVYGHSCILSAASPILAAVIRKTARKDAMQKKYIPKSVILVSDVDSVTLTEVFRWIYTGQVEGLPQHQTSLLLAAEKFLLPSLRALCTASILRTLPPEQAHYHLARMPLDQRMPEVCLLAVFGHLPLTELFPLTGVCKRWRDLLKAACASRRTLTILGAEARRVLPRVQPRVRSPCEIPHHPEELASEGYEGDQLRMPGLSSQRKHSIHRELLGQTVDWFPNLTRLRLAFVNICGKTLLALGEALFTKHSKLTSLGLNLKLAPNSVTAAHLSGLFRSLEQHYNKGSTPELTELSLICRMYGSDRDGLGGEEMAFMEQLVQPPVIGSLRSLTYHCSFPFDCARFKQSVRSEMPHLTALAIFCPSFAPPDEANRYRDYDQYLRPLSDLTSAEHGLEPYRELMSGPNALPGGIFSNLGVVFLLPHQDMQPLQPLPFTGLRSLRLQVRLQQRPSLVQVMATLAHAGLSRSLVHLKLDLGAVVSPPPNQPIEPNATKMAMKRMASLPFPVLSVLELKLCGGVSLAEPYVARAGVLATIAPHLRVLSFDLDYGVRCSCAANNTTATANTGQQQRGIPLSWAHVPCIRPMMDAFTNALDGNGNSMPNLTRLLIRFHMAKDFEHWSDIVRTWTLQESIKASISQVTD